jgi:dTMP kinase
MFITFEGPEGAGKSSQARALVEGLRSRGHVVVFAHEPGATPVGEAIRQLVLAPLLWDAVNAKTEVLLFAAARAQLVEDVIRPGLARGDIVICDRFSDSTYAYQVGGRGLPEGKVESVSDFATDGLMPDLTFLLDVDVATGLARKDPAGADRLEQEELGFHERVRAAYLRLAKAEPERVTCLDARRPFADLSREIWTIVLTRLGNNRLAAG